VIRITFLTFKDQNTRNQVQNNSLLVQQITFVLQHS